MLRSVADDTPKPPAGQPQRRDRLAVRRCSLAPATPRIRLSRSGSSGWRRHDGLALASRRLLRHYSIDACRCADAGSLAGSRGRRPRRRRPPRRPRPSTGQREVVAPAPRRRPSSSGRRCRGRRRPASTRGRRPGARCGAVAVDEDEVGALARLDRADLVLPARAPARRRASPSRRRRGRSARPGPCASPGASPRAASRRTCRAGCCRPRRRRRARPRCRARASPTTGAMPDPSFRFEPGQCSTLTSRSASSACSRVGDPDAVRGAQPPAGEARCRRGTRGSTARPTAAARRRPRPAILGGVRVHERLFARPTAPPPLRAARASTTPRSAARTRRAAGRSPRRASAAAAPGSRRSTPASAPAAARGTSSSESIMHLPTVARSPIVGERLEHDVGVVHRLHRQHRRGAGAAAARRPRAAPRRAASTGCAPLPSARRAAAASRAAAGRRRSRGTASGRDGRGSG